MTTVYFYKLHAKCPAVSSSALEVIGPEPGLHTLKRKTKKTINNFTVHYIIV